MMLNIKAIGLLVSDEKIFSHFHLIKFIFCMFDLDMQGT